MSKNSEGYLQGIPGSPGIPPGLHMHKNQVFRLVRAGSFDEVDDLVNLDGRVPGGNDCCDKKSR